MAYFPARPLSIVPMNFSVMRGGGGGCTGPVGTGIGGGVGPREAVDGGGGGAGFGLNPNGFLLEPTGPGRPVRSESRSMSVTCPF